MKIILDQQRVLLNKMIGCSIRFGLLPSLNVNIGGCLPDDCLYNANMNYGSFYSSSVLNLRMKEANGNEFWITISPGPDAPVEPWSPLGVISNPGFDSGKIKKDYSFYKEKIGHYPKGSMLEIADQENEFLKKHSFDFGLNMISKWLDHEKIIQIEIYDCSPYIACIIQHNTGKEWSIYAEYDFEFWLNFSQSMVKGIRKNCKLYEIIK